MSTSQEADVDLWSSILNSVKSSKAIVTRNLVVLGEPKCGKSTLISSLTSGSGLVTGVKGQGQAGNVGLSYSYFDVGDEKDKDEIVARVGVYTLPSSQPSYAALLPLAFPELTTSTSTQEQDATATSSQILPKASMAALKDSLVVLLLDWEQPWTFLEQLRTWLNILHDLINTASDQGLTQSTTEFSRARVALDEMKERLEHYLASYVEPTTATQDPVAITGSTLGQVPELAEGTLTHNWGVSIVIVCTKADAIPRLERDKNFKEEQFDYIQQVLRTVCMKYGAALFYASSQRPQSMDIVRSYILHRLFPGATFPFTHRASTTDRDTLLVPAGWDSWGKIKALRDPFDCKAMGRGWDSDFPTSRTLQDQSDEHDGLSAIKLYEDIVSDWELGPTGKDQTGKVKLPDEQSFLAQHYATLQKDPDPRAKFSKAGVVGPISASSRDLPSVERLMTRQDTDSITPAPTRPSVGTRQESTPINAAKREYTSAAAAAAVAGMTSPAASTGGATSPAGGPPKQSEVLHSFFQSLLKDKGSSGSPKPSDRLRTVSSTKRE